MEKLAKKIAHNRVIILIIALALLIPSAIGYIKTGINYDVLSYLPSDLETMQAEKIMKDDFGCGSLTMLIVEGMDDKDVSALKDKVAKIDGVNKVIWKDDFLDLSFPTEMLPEDMRNILYADNSTMMVVMLKEGSASLNTMNAIEQIRKVTGEQAFLSGAAGIVKDTKDLSDKETPIYVILAVILSVIILGLTMDSFAIPFVFLASIGIAIIYNLGTNVIFGEISYITKALSAILQLGVTMDYSIFLLHRYDEERATAISKEDAMAKAIENTIVSITGSSLTTVAGFLALCVMSLTLGKDIGLVMAKGVVFGVICTVTVLPALILTFDNLIHKYTHKTLLPTFDRTSDFVVKHYKALVIVAALVFIPALIGKLNAGVYYNLDKSLPQTLPSIVGTNKMKNDYNMQSTNMILVSQDLDNYKIKNMTDEIEKVDGVTSVFALEKYLGAGIPQDFIPQDVMEIVQGGGYEMFVVNSEYKAASPEVSTQLEKINSIIKKYDENSLLCGEAPLTDDLIKITDVDFKNVSIFSILAIFVIIALVFMSISLPVLLVLAIELAIFVNLGIPFYTGSTLPFIASIVIGTIQLGATVDYAILMTSRFKEELGNGHPKKEAMEIAVRESAKSIVTSGLTFFGATGGVALVSDMPLISSLCFLLARGAIISMLVILLILPSLLLVFEGIINRTTLKWKPKNIMKAQKAEAEN